MTTKTRIEVREVGTKRAVKQLLGLQHELHNAEPAFRAVFRALLRVDAAIFSSQGGAGQGAWQKLKANTVTRKANAGYSSKAGRASDAMFAALTQQGASGQVTQFGPQQMRFGIDLQNAKGMPYPFAFNKRRPLLAKDKEVQAIVAREMDRHFGRAFK